MLSTNKKKFHKKKSVSFKKPKKPLSIKTNKVTFTLRVKIIKTNLYSTGQVMIEVDHER